MDIISNLNPLQQAINVSGIPQMFDHNMQQEMNTNQFDQLSLSGIIRGLSGEGETNNIPPEQCAAVQPHVIVAPRPVQTHNDMNIKIIEQPQDDHDYKFR